MTTRTWSTRHAHRTASAREEAPQRQRRVRFQGQDSSPAPRKWGEVDSPDEPDITNLTLDARQLERGRRWGPNPDDMQARAQERDRAAAAKAEEATLGNLARARIQAIADAMQFGFRQIGWTWADKLLRHYRQGQGEPMVIPADIIRDYAPVVARQDDVLREFALWLLAEDAKHRDSTWGTPTVGMRDGQRRFVGVSPGGPSFELRNRVMWEKVFDSANVASEARATIASETLQGFGQFMLERDGDTIIVRGDLRLRVKDQYDFLPEHETGFGLLPEAGLATPFDVYTSNWERPVVGRIRLQNGRPFIVNLGFDDDEGGAVEASAAIR